MESTNILSLNIVLFLFSLIISVSARVQITANYPSFGSPEYIINCLGTANPSDPSHLEILKDQTFVASFDYNTDKSLKISDGMKNKIRLIKNFSDKNDKSMLLKLALTKPTATDSGSYKCKFSYFNEDFVRVDEEDSTPLKITTNPTSPTTDDPLHPSGTDIGQLQTKISALEEQLKKQKEDFSKQLTDREKSLKDEIMVAITKQSNGLINANKDIKRLSDAATQTSTKLKQANEENNNKNKEIKDLNTKLKKLESISTKVDKNKETNEKEIQGLNATISDLENKMKDQKTDYETKLKALANTRQQELQSKVDGIAKEIKDDNNGLVQKVSFNAEIQMLQTKLTAKLQKQMNMVNQKLQDFGGSGSSVTVTELQSKLLQVEGQISPMQSKISDLENQFGHNDNALESKLNDLTIQVDNKLKDHLKGVESKTSQKVNFLMDGIYKQINSKVNEKSKLTETKLDGKIKDLTSIMDYFGDFVNVLNSSQTDYMEKETGDDARMKQLRFNFKNLQEQFNRLVTLEQHVQDSNWLLFSKVLTLENTTTEQFALLNQSFADRVNELQTIMTFVGTTNFVQGKDIRELTDKVGILSNIDNRVLKLEDESKNHTQNIDMLASSDVLKTTNDRVMELEKLTSNHSQLINNLTLTGNELVVIAKRLDDKDMLDSKQTKQINGKADQTSMDHTDKIVNILEEQALTLLYDLKQIATKLTNKLNNTNHKILSIGKLAEDNQKQINNLTIGDSELDAIAQRLDTMDELNRNQTVQLEGKAGEDLVQLMHDKLHDKVKDLEDLSLNHTEQIDNLTMEGKKLVMIAHRLNKTEELIRDHKVLIDGKVEQTAFDTTKNIVNILSEQALTTLYNMKQLASQDSLENTNDRVKKLEKVTFNHTTIINNLTRDDQLGTIEVKIDELREVNDNQTHMIEDLVLRDDLQKDTFKKLEETAKNHSLAIQGQADKDDSQLQKIKSLEELTHNHTIDMQGFADKVSVAKLQKVVKFVKDQLLMNTADISKKASKDSVGLVVKQVSDLEKVVANLSLHENDYADKVTVAKLLTEVKDMQRNMDNHTTTIHQLIEQADHVAAVLDFVNFLTTENQNQTDQINKLFERANELVTLAQRLDEKDELDRNQTQLIDEKADQASLKTIKNTLNILESQALSQLSDIRKLAQKKIVTEISDRMNALETNDKHQSEMLDNLNNVTAGVSGLIKPTLDKVGVLEKSTKNISERVDNVLDKDSVELMLNKVSARANMTLNQLSLLNSSVDGDVALLTERVNRMQDLLLSEVNKVNKFSAKAGQIDGLVKSVADLGDNATDQYQLINQLSNKAGQIDGLVKSVADLGDNATDQHQLINQLSNKVVQQIATFEDVHTNLSTTIDDVSKKGQKVVAFSAGFLTYQQVKSNDVLKFDDIITNIGNGYDPKTGVFTAPVPGVYAFTVTVTSKAAGGKWMDLELLANGKQLTVLENKEPTHENQVTINSMAKLKQGDEVKVSVMYVAGTSMKLTNKKLSEFTGYLVRYVD